MSEQDRRNTNEDESVLGDGNDGNTNNNGDGDSRDEDNKLQMLNPYYVMLLNCNLREGKTVKTELRKWHISVILLTYYVS